MLDALHIAVIERLQADLLGVYCAAYPKLSRKVTVPATLVELDELEPDDFGSELFDCYARFTAYCVYDPNAANAEREVRNLAALVAVRVSQEADFSIDVAKPAQVLHVGEDSFKPELDGYLVWAVEFQVGITIGEDVWAIDPAAGASVIEINVGDLDVVHIDKKMGDGQEPPASDDISLPDQPKG